jgi:membrane associated rhomboid family serine protease
MPNMFRFHNVNTVVPLDELQQYSYGGEYSYGGDAAETQNVGYGWGSRRHPVRDFRLRMARIMRPVKQSVNKRRRIGLTEILIGVNCAVFLLCQMNPRLTMDYMKSNRMIYRYGQKYRLLTSMFLHGSVMHLASNSFSLYNVGPEVERLFGRGRYLLTYLGSGILANIATYALGVSQNSLGASGSIFGVVGALGFFWFRNQEAIGPLAGAMLHSLKRTLMMNAMYSFYFPGIDHYGHVFGCLSGALLCLLIGPRLSVVNRFGAQRIADKPIIKLPKFLRNLSFSTRTGKGQIGDGYGGEGNDYYGSGTGKISSRGRPTY